MWTKSGYKLKLGQSWPKTRRDLDYNLTITWLKLDEIWTKTEVNWPKTGPKLDQPRLKLGQNWNLLKQKQKKLGLNDKRIARGLKAQLLK